MSKPILQLKSAEFIPLSEVRSLIGQPLKVEIPQGKVTPEGISDILSYLKEAYPGVELPCPKGTTFFEWTWLDPKHGTLPKRMAKWLKKRLQQNPDQKVIAHVGNLARQNSDDNQAYYFRIVDKVDWDATQFGKDGGGCWWGSNGGNRSYGRPDKESHAVRFINNDGLGVQFFRGEDYRYDNGIGRLWIYLEPSYRFAATFNGYWENEGATLRLTRVLATYLGLGYKQCKTLTTDFRIYINDDKGYFIGDEQALNFLHKDASYRIPKKTFYKPCSRCKESFDQEILGGFEGMCHPCYRDSRKLCPNCSSRKDSSTFKQVRTNEGLVDWCNTCVQYSSRGCRGCRNAYVSKYFNYPGCVKVDDVYMCTKCTMSARKCQDCGKRTLNTDAMDDPLCLKCEDLFEKEIKIESDGAGDVVTLNADGTPQWLGRTPRVELRIDPERFRLAVEHSNEAMRRLRETLANGESELVRRIRNAAVRQETVDDEESGVPF